MKLKVHGAHGRRWLVSRPVLAWRPPLRGQGDDRIGGAQPLGMGGLIAVAGAPEATQSMVRQRAERRLGRRSTQWPLYIAGPVYVAEMLVCIPVTGAIGVWKEVTRRPWTVKAFSEHPKPIEHEEDVVGWRASGRRARAIAGELRDGEGPAWAQ